MSNNSTHSLTYCTDCVNFECFFVLADADTDVDFDPTADMLVHDYDDERTLDEEEAMSNEESVANELDDLQKVRLFWVLPCGNWLPIHSLQIYLCEGGYFCLAIVRITQKLWMLERIVLRTRSIILDSVSDILIKVQGVCSFFNIAKSLACI